MTTWVLMLRKNWFKNEILRIDCNCFLSFDHAKRCSLTIIIVLSIVKFFLVLCLFLFLAVDLLPEIRFWYVSLLWSQLKLDKYNPFTSVKLKSVKQIIKFYRCFYSQSSFSYSYCTVHAMSINTRNSLRQNFGGILQSVKLNVSMSRSV